MRRLGLFLISAGIGFALAFPGAVSLAPSLIMSAAMKRVTGQTQANGWSFAPRTTEASRQIVRPSPDLAYATCRFDLRGGPIEVKAAASPAGDYFSISFYAANTDNFAAFNDRNSPSGVDVVLALPGQATPPGRKVVISPSAQGLVLDRRLAPDEARFARIDEVRRANSCAPVKTAGAGPT